MNYRHIYHAGNFADVFKHTILIMLTQSLCKKDSPFMYLDTHAGIGKYDLTTKIAQKTKEYKNGIEKIYNLQLCPASIKTYQQIIKEINNQSESLDIYPGSPLIVSKLLRAQDSMVLTELHKEDARALKQEFRQNKQVAVHNSNGYLGLKAFLPPKSGRGLVLIDPPFEETNELENIAARLQIALKRFTNGMYAIWYPIKDDSEIQSFYSKLKTLECKNILAVELATSKSTQNSGLASCGMVIINAPWKFDDELKEVVPWLSKALAVDRTAACKIRRLRG